MSSGGKGRKAAGAHKSVSKSHKAGLKFPVGSALVYLSAVLEYLTAKVLLMEVYYHISLFIYTQLKKIQAKQFDLN
ncbi:unnamed protein product [Paramecium primaurelia]|uniref:Histone H2A n=1 Tax=Paramecium primaurelia TaxID=5886 RepID=A0A8S1Q548_PARPR|nr:unnamed protein product [Paramecium primaurelia]